MTSPEIHLKKLFIRIGYGMMHFRFWNLWQVFFQKQPCRSDMVKKHTSADRRSRKNEPALTDLRKRVYHCKTKGYFRKNGRETGAVTGLWQPPETTSEEEGKKVCGTHRKVQEDI